VEKKIFEGRSRRALRASLATFLKPLEKLIAQLYFELILTAVTEECQLGRGIDKGYSALQNTLLNSRSLNG
jgi:hypothetical protein